MSEIELNVAQNKDKGNFPDDVRIEKRKKDEKNACAAQSSEYYLCFTHSAALGPRRRCNGGFGPPFACFESVKTISPTLRLWALSAALSGGKTCA